MFWNSAAASRHVKTAALFQNMIATHIVMYAIHNAAASFSNHISLSGVQITAGGIAAQGPARANVLLPCGNAEGEFKQGGNATQCQRFPRSFIRLVEIGICLLYTSDAADE